MAGLGAQELIIVLVVILVLFGGTQLPKLAKNLGKAQQEFKAGLNEAGKDTKPAPKPDDGPTATPES
jgi:sec-independent protein translocase protein TatA